VRALDAVTLSSDIPNHVQVASDLYEYMAVRGLDTQLEPLDDWGVCDERLYKKSGPYSAHVFATFGIRADCGRVAYLAVMAVIGAIFESDCGWNFVYSANFNGAQVGHLQRYAQENDFSPFLAYMRIQEQEGPGVTRILNGFETRGFELSKANINHNHVRVLQLYHEPFLVKDKDLSHGRADNESGLLGEMDNGCTGPG
jgi:hypothetical protein